MTKKHIVTAPFFIKHILSLKIFFIFAIGKTTKSDLRRLCGVAF